MRRRPSLVLVAVFAVLGFLVVTTIASARIGQKEAEPRKAELIKLIQQRRAQIDDLDEDVSRLRDDVAAAQKVASARSRQDTQLAERLDELAEAAGTIALKGDAVVVRLSDSDKKPSDPDEAGAYRIRDADLQLVVNALFAAGAEAIAVNDSRVVSTTPIRAAGDTIVVNFRPLNPPYTVKAIGADRAAFEASEIVKRFNRWQKLFGLGFRIREEVATVPAYTGRVAISTAVPSSGEGD